MLKSIFMNKRRIPLYLFLAIVGGLDCCLWIIMMIQPGNIRISPIHFLGIRIGFCIFLFLFVRSQLKLESINSDLAGIFTMIFFFGFSIFGIAGMMFVLNMVFNKSFQTGTLYHIDKEEGELQEDLERRDILIDINELRRVAPLVDGMTGENKDIRIATIQAMDEVASDSVRKLLQGFPNDKSKEVQYGDTLKKISELLKESKRDDFKEVQYYANDALKNISDAYTEKIKHLLGDVNRNPPNYETYKNLADLYAQFAEINIEHPVLVKFYQQEAVKYYSYVLENYPQHRKAILEKFIPALYQTKDYAQCLEYCEEIQQDPELSSLSILYKARCLFSMRKISSLKQFAANVRDSNITTIDNFVKLSRLALYG